MNFILVDYDLGKTLEKYLILICISNTVRVRKGL